MTNQSPFLDIKSFEMEEPAAGTEAPGAQVPSTSPFLSLYSTEGGEGLTNPEAGEYMVVLNELYDEEFDRSIYELLSEAVELGNNRLTYETSDSRTHGYAAEQMLAQHFTPLMRASEGMINFLTTNLANREATSLTEGEIEDLVDRYQPPEGLSPEFENFFGVLKKVVGKVAGAAASLAKKGIGAVAQLGLGPILKRLWPLVKEMLNRVLRTAIERLPAELQPIARNLAERLSFLKEIDEESAQEAGYPAGDSTEIQQEFNVRVANLLFAPGEVEQDLEIAQMQSEAQSSGTDSLEVLDQARARFVDSLGRLKEGEDPTPLVENFIPALLPLLKIGFKIAGGRKQVVGLLARPVANIIRRFVGPHAPALSRAIVSTGLNMIGLETTPQNETLLASEAVAATVEETVRRVSALPEYVLEDQELLEGYILRSFEQAAAANLPPVLSEETYRQRPDLLEAQTMRGAWISRGLGRWRRYKKFNRVAHVRVTPYKAEAIETFGGAPLADFLEEQLGLQPGEDLEANVHLYEILPGGLLTEITSLEQDTPGLGSRAGYELLHPLTPEAAGLLLGEPGLGREVNPSYLASPFTSEVGQRFYYLEAPGKRPLTTPQPGGGPALRQRTRLRLALNFASSQITMRLFLSEVRAQKLAARLRQPAHVGALAASLQPILERRLRCILTGRCGGLKIIHEAVAPKQSAAALSRLPSQVPQILLRRLQGWALTGLAGFFKQNAQQFIQATEDAADGATLVIQIANPPGFAALGQALKGKTPALASFNMSGATPNVAIRVIPGYARA